MPSAGRALARKSVPLEATRPSIARAAGRPPALLFAVAAAAAIFIQYQMYFHFWLVSLLDRYVVSTLAPIATLACIAFLIVARTRVSLRLTRLRTVLLFLGIYVVWACWSVLVNEESLDNIRRYLIYVASPVGIFGSLVVIYGSSATARLRQVVGLIVLAGLALSVYVAISYSGPGIATVENLSNIELDDITIYADSGAAYGMEAVGLWAKRFTIPGINSTTYGPMLVPLVGMLLFLWKHSSGWRRTAALGAAGFLSYCVLMTVSRGPLLALIILLLYLGWRGLITRRLAVAGGLAFLVAGATVGRLAVLRLVVTVVKPLPLADRSALRNWALELIPADDPRLLSIPETLGISLQHPFLGAGMSRLIEIQAGTFGKEHNNYLTVLAAFGLVAGVSYLLFVFSLLWTAHKKARTCQTAQERDFGAAITAGVLACVVYSNFAPADFHFLWVWYGLAAAWISSGAGGLSVVRPLRLGMLGPPPDRRAVT